MLDEKMVAELIEKLRARAEDNPEVAKDVLEVLTASYGQDKNEPAREIAKTVCELLEPERIGPLLWIRCNVCGRGLTDMDERGICSSCLLGK
jgi:formylmethanofuran dehydrogenase subunit E